MSAPQRKALVEVAEAPREAGRPRRWPWLLVLAYMGLIFYLSSKTDPLPDLTERVWDKALHFLEYGALAALLLFALRSSEVAARRAGLLAVAVVSLYGASDELHQAFVPGRSCDARDWAADTVGAALCVAGWAGSRRLSGARLDIGPGRR